MPANDNRYIFGAFAIIAGQRGGGDYIFLGKDRNFPKGRIINSNWRLTEAKWRGTDAFGETHSELIFINVMAGRDIKRNR